MYVERPNPQFDAGEAVTSEAVTKAIEQCREVDTHAALLRGSQAKLKLSFRTPSSNLDQVNRLPVLSLYLMRSCGRLNIHLCFLTGKLKRNIWPQWPKELIDPSSL